MTKETNETPKSRGLDDLRDDLNQALHPAAGTDMLHRQALLLNEMLAALTGDDVAARLGNGDYMNRWVDMVLKIQKQCADTVKTIGAVEYMKICGSRCATSSPHPVYRENEKKESNKCE